MYFIEDENFARRLQYEEEAYENFKRQKEEKLKENLNPVASTLEFTDPTPNIHDLFVKFDKKFFWSKLGMVQVVWSQKMTKCAGVCSFESRGGLCRIALSAPLLSLRPRKDLVETLLHEMIHAYLFVTRNYKDRDDHGPEFHKHMYRINKEAGTKITVYHSFVDEVHYYQRHVWRCNGPCQKKKPYFGILRRAVNRAPGPTDPWWNQHKAECGGTYIKISEPEKTVKKNKKVSTVKPGEKCKDIREFFNKKGASNSANKSSNIRTLGDIKVNSVTGLKTTGGNGTVVITNVKKGKKVDSKSPKSPNMAEKTSSSASNLVKKSGESGFGIKSNKSSQNGNLRDSRSEKENPQESCSQRENPKESDDSTARETVRNIWANKFKNTVSQNGCSPEKKVKVQCPVCDEAFPEEEIENHVDKCLQNTNSDTNTITESSTCGDSDYVNCPVCSEKILQSGLNDHLEGCLSCTFQNEDDKKFEEEVVCESIPCPCCYKWFKESEMNDHIDECLTFNSLKGEMLLLY